LCESTILEGSLEIMPRKKVLIVDDEVDLCLLMKAYFNRKNYEVYLAHSLSEGIKELQKISPDVLFIDNNLPDGYGWDIIGEMSERFPNTKYHLTSAFRSVLPTDVDRSKITLWEKPISLKDLDRVFE
jgi:DNA-binding NtrC family response regulator